MNRRRNVGKRILGLVFALVFGFMSVPKDAFAASVDSAENRAQYGGSAAENSARYSGSSGGTAMVTVDTGITRDEVTGETEWHEDPYPLDILIIDPDPDIEPEEDKEPEDIAGEESPEEDIADGSAETDIDFIYADGTAVVSGDYTYTTSGEKATITKYEGTEENLIIPAELDGFPVAAIGSSAFTSNESIKSVIIPDSVTSIGSYAFKGCTSLSSLTLPSSLKTIGNSAFYSDSALTELTIPASVTSIGSNSFYGSVKKITFADGFTTIPNDVCYGASELETAVIPETVTKIGNYAFYQCKQLKTVQLPAGLTSIGNSAFYQCNALETVRLPGGLTSIGDNSFYQCSKLSGVILPDTLKEIGGSAFYSDSALTELTIPASVTSIGSNAFYGSVKEISFAGGMQEIPANACYGAGLLESVSIPDTVVKLGNYAFYQCKKLTAVRLPSGLTSIGNYAFSQCSDLEDIQLPENLTSIGSDAFYNCSNLKDVVLPDSLTNIGASAFYGATKLNEITIPASVTVIGKSAFYNSVKKISFADGITEIPENACYNASNLEEAIIPDSVVDIGKYTFYRAKKLTSAQLPKNLQVIGDYAFYECTSMDSFQLPAGLTSIGADAFYGCNKLTSMILPEGLTTIGTGAFYNCSGLEVVSIPSTVTKMAQSIFYNSAKSVIFSDKMTVIPDNACDGATNLSQIALPDGLISIGKRAFYGCKLLEQVTIPDGTKSVGDSAFYGDTALTLRVPASLTEIGSNAFSGCTLIKPCGNNAEWKYDQEEKVITITGTGEIGNGSGNVCDPFADDVQFVEIEAGITKIGDHSFEGMDKLTGVVMGDNIKEIGVQAFDNCTSLERVELPKEIEKIEDEAFKGCDTVDTIIFTGSIPQIEDNALPSKEITAYYPKDSEESVKKTKEKYSGFNWKPWDNTLPVRDVVLVLDVSGSMSGDRIKNLKQAVIAFSEKVGGRISNTRIGIVTYASDAKKVMSFSTDVTRMKASAERMSSGGSTYYLKGFDVADELLNSSKADVKSIIVFSDGAPSDNRNTILSRAEGYRDLGYYVYSVGLAPTDSNRELLINIAGDEQNYFEADDIDALIDRFVEMSEGIGRSGTCGDNVKWKYNDSNKELVISLNGKTSGNGKMYDFGTGNAPAWDAYAETLEKIRIENGVTYIGTNAFSKLGNITSVYIGKSVTEIGAGAFSGCTKLGEVNYTGSEDDWKKIVIGDNNQPLLNAVIKYGAKGEGAVTGLIVKPAAATVGINDKTTLTAEVFPKTAKNKSVTWTSSNESVATVSNTGKVTPKSVGTTIITATSDDGGYTGTCDVTVTNNIPVIQKFSFGGSSTGIKIDKSVPLIGDKTYSVGLPASLPVSCVVEDNKIKIGINIKKESLYSYNSTEGVTTTTKKKSVKEQFEDFKKNAYKATLMSKDEDWLKNIQDEKFLKANMPGKQGSVDFNCVGYVEGAWSDSIDKLEGSVVLTVSGSATLQHQMVVWVIPVTVNCKFDATGKLIADVGYDFKKAQWYGDLALAASFGIEPYAGIGFGEWLSGGVYGRGQTDFKVIVLSSRDPLGLKEWSLSGEMGLKGYFAKKSGTFPIVDGTYYIFKDYNLLLGTGNDTYADAGMDGTGLLEDGMIITTLEATQGIQNDTAASDGTVVSNAYNAAKPTLITANGVSMLIYVADDTSRSILNQTKLVYSIYDPVSGTFSSARAVLDDGTADYEPEVYTDGSDIYVAWLDSSKVFAESEDPELKDYMKTFGAHVAKYDAAGNVFEDMGTPQANACYTYMPKLYKSGDALQLAWVENKDDALLGLSDKNSIYRAVYKGGSWSAADEISGLNSVTSLDIGSAASSSEVSVAYVLDQDNDLATGDQDLYVRSTSGVSAKVQSGNISSVTYTALPGVTGTVLALNKDGGLYYLNGSSLTPVLEDGTMNAGTKFAVSGDKIVYLRSGDGERNLAVAAYDNGSWGSSLLTHESGYIDSFSVSDGRVSYLYSDAAHRADGNWNVVSSVKILGSLDYNDVELETIDYALADACEGSDLPVDLYIKNNGVSRLTKVHTSVAYGGRELTSSDISVDLMPGEVKPYDYTFTIPAALTSGGDFIITTTCDDDLSGGNNSQTLSLKKADLEVMASYDASGTTPYINVTVENRGLVDSNMNMTIKDENGNILFKKSGTVAAGDFVTYKEAYTSGKEQILTISAVGDAEEFYEMNNTTWLKVGSSQDEPGPVITDSFSVGFANTASDPYEGLSYNASEKRYETVYTGSAITPEVVVTGLNGRLTEGVDYSVKYSNNVKYDKNGRAAIVTVSGKGNYAGKVPLEFHILQADLNTAKAKGMLTVPDVIKVQSGKKLSPVITYLDYTLKAADIDLSEKGAIKGNTIVSINGKGNFTGKIENVNVSVVTAAEAKQYVIKAAVKATEHNYNGEPQYLTYSTPDNMGELTVTADASKKPLIMGTDYDVKYYSNTAAGTAKVVVFGKGEYTGSETKTFKIQPDKASVITADLTEPGIVEYDPLGTMPSVTVRVSGSGKILTLGKDYTISYGNNKKTGTGKYTVKFIGNYKGHAAIGNKTFEIGAATFSGAKAVVGDMLYSKGGKNLSVPYVMLKGVRLTSKDYTVKYYDGSKEITGKEKISLDNGANIKQITVKITGKGNYKPQTITTSYRVIKADIAPVDLSKAKIVAEKKGDNGKDVKVDKQEYTGDEVRPDIRVLVKNGNRWEEVSRSAYDVAYVNNVNKGKATILISGNGTDTMGSKTEKFTIGTKNLGLFERLF